MKDEGKLHRFHESLGKYYDVPDYDTFKADMGLSTTAQQSPTGQAGSGGAAAQGTGQPTGTAPQGTVVASAGEMVAQGAQPGGQEWFSSEELADLNRPTPAGYARDSRNRLSKTDDGYVRAVGMTPEEQAMQERMSQVGEIYDEPEAYSFEPDAGDGKMHYSWRNGRRVGQLDRGALRFAHIGRDYSSEAYRQAEQEAADMTDEQLKGAFDRLYASYINGGDDALTQGYGREDASRMMAYATEMRYRDIGMGHARDYGSDGKPSATGVYHYHAARMNPAVSKEMDAQDKMGWDQRLSYLSGVLQDQRARENTINTGVDTAEDRKALEADRRKLLAGVMLYARDNNIYPEDAYRIVVGAANNATPKDSGFWAGFTSTTSQMWRDVKYFFGEAANLVANDRGDVLDAISALDKYGEDAETKLIAGTLHNMGLLGMLMFDGDEAGASEGAGRILADCIVKGKDGRIDIDATRAALLAKLKTTYSWGDRTMRDNVYNTAMAKQVEGDAAWWGQQVAQLVPTTAAIVVGVTTKNPALAETIGQLGMGYMCISSGSQAMQEARMYGADDNQVWTAGIVNAALEYLTEKIPFDRYTKRVFGEVKAASARKLMDAVVDVNNPAHHELQQLLESAMKELGANKGKIAKAYTGDLLAEGSSEFVAGVLQKASEIMYKNPEDYPTFMEILEDGVEGFKGGAAMGGIMSSVSNSATYAQADNRRRKAGVVSVGLYEGEDGMGVPVEIIDHDRAGNYIVLDGQHNEMIVAPGKLKGVTTYTYDEWKRGEVQQQDDEAQSRGYNAQGDEREQVQDDLQRAEQRLDELDFDLSSFEGWTSDAFEQRIASGEHDYTDEDIEAIREYFRAKAASEGMQQRVDDDIDTQVQQASDLVDKQTNQGTGMVHRAVLNNGQEVYVTGGQLVMTGDGTMIDTEASDESLFVYNPATGQPEQYTPQDFQSVEDPVSPDRLKSEAARDIRQAMLQKAEADMNGYVQQGGSYDMMDEQGNTMHGTVVELRPDNTAVVQVDGEQIPLAVQTQQLQAWVDNAKQKRMSVDNGAGQVGLPGRTGQTGQVAANGRGEAATQETAPVAPATVESLPMDEKTGEPVWNETTPEQGYNHLMQSGLTGEDIGTMIDDRIAQADAAIEKASHGGTIDQRLQARQAKDYWENVKQLHEAAKTAAVQRPTGQAAATQQQTTTNGRGTTAAQGTAQPGTAAATTTAASVPAGTVRVEASQAETMPVGDVAVNPDGTRAEDRGQLGIRREDTEYFLRTMSPRMMGLLDKVAKSLGWKIRLYNGENANERGHYLNGVVWVNRRAMTSKLAQWILGHEMTHGMGARTGGGETFKDYIELANKLKRQEWGDKAYEQYIKDTIDAYKEHLKKLNMDTSQVDRAYIEEEIACDVTGDLLTNNPEMIGKLFSGVESPGRLQRIIDMIVDYLDKLKSKLPFRSEERRALDDLTKRLNSLYRDAKAQTDIAKATASEEGSRIESGDGERTGSSFSITGNAEGSGFTCSETVLEVWRVPQEDGTYKEEEHWVKKPLLDSEGNVVFRMNGREFSVNNPITVDDLKSNHDTALNYMLGDALRAGTIDEVKADQVRQQYADMLNLYLEKGVADENGNGFENLEKKWLWVGETVFRTVASNSDEQYSYSIDITKVCKKNEAVIRAISALQVKNGYGVTPAQILEIYEATDAEGFQVPCPVCYVFSRYINNGKYATAIVNGMQKYGKHLPGQPDAWPVEKWVEVMNAAKDQTDKMETALKHANEDVKIILQQIDTLCREITGGGLSAEEAESKRRHVLALDQRYRAALDVISQEAIPRWIKSFVLEGSDQGGWRLREDAALPEDMDDFIAHALDIRKTASAMERYPSITRYRRAGGSAGGKEITFASNNELGTIIMGLGVSKGNLDDYPNYYQLAAEAATDEERQAYLQKARERFDNARLYVQRQTLRGGQRMWSWSDNIESLSSDVASNLMQLELLGGALQTYSKQLEGVKMVAAMNGYVNASLMGYGDGIREVGPDDIIEVGPDKKRYLKRDILDVNNKGRERIIANGYDPDTRTGTPVYHNAADGKDYVLVFDDVVGIDPFGRDGKRGLFSLNEEYDRAGNILVGMNDIHVRAAMADPRVFFIIPWHASGMHNHILRQMFNILGVNMDRFVSTDYTNMQEETNFLQRTEKGKLKYTVSADVEAFWDSHSFEDEFACGTGHIENGDHQGGLSESQLHYRELRDAIFDGTIDNEDKNDWKDQVEADEFLSQVYRQVTTHVADGKMTEKDKEFIYPYEYWDETSTVNNADVNGRRYLEYCRRMGFKPKFTGKYDKKAGTLSPEGNFADDPGYWKLLIDRRMYDRRGNYQGLTAVDSSGLDSSMYDPDQTQEEFNVTEVATNEGAEKIADMVNQRDTERTGTSPAPNLDMEMDQAVAKYNEVMALQASLIKAEKKALEAVEKAKQRLEKAREKEAADVDGRKTKSVARAKESARKAMEVAREKAREVDEIAGQLGTVRDNIAQYGTTRFSLSTEIAARYPNWMDNQVIDDEESKQGQRTQVKTTLATYKKLADWIDKHKGKDLSVLDASSGLGYGTEEFRARGFNIEDIEPYPSGKRMKENPPTYGGVDAYQRAMDDGKQYDFIISNAVLNVIPDDWRRGVLHDMATLLAPGGKMFINTRKKGGEKNIKNKIELESPYELLVGKPDKITSYQRFFGTEELKDYVERELGEGFTVEVATPENSGTNGDNSLAAVVVTKTGDSTPRFSIEQGAKLAPQYQKATYEEMASGLIPFNGKLRRGAESKFKVVDDEKKVFDNWYGTRQKRYKYNVGKEMGAGIYVHKDYAGDIVPADVLDKAKAIAEREGIEYKIVYYEPKKPNMVRLDEAPDFDTAREPIPGKWTWVDTETGELGKTGNSKQIWHNKWMWVKDDYKGFDVDEAYEWSKTWNQEISKPDGWSYKWDYLLDQAGLPKDWTGSALAAEEPVQSTDTGDQARFSISETSTDEDGREVYTERRNDGTLDREVVTNQDGSKTVTWFDEDGNRKEVLDYYPNGEVRRVRNFNEYGNMTRSMEYDEDRRQTRHWEPSIGTDWKRDENGIARGRSNGVEMVRYSLSDIEVPELSQEAKDYARENEDDSYERVIKELQGFFNDGNANRLRQSRDFWAKMAKNYERELKKDTRAGMSDRWILLDKFGVESNSKKAQYASALLDGLIQGRTDHRNWGIKRNKEISMDEMDELFDANNTDMDNASLWRRTIAVSRQLGIDNIKFKKTPEGVSGRIFGGRIRFSDEYFNDNAFSDNQKCETMLHEMIHHVTVYALDHEERLNDVQKNAVNELKNIYLNLKEDPSFKGLYGIKNVKEMVAELANPIFRDALKKKNLFYRIVDSIRRIFFSEVPEQEGLYMSKNAYRAVLENFAKLLDNFNNDAYDTFAEDMRKYRPRYSLDVGNLATAATYFSGGGLVEEGLKGVIDPKIAVEYDRKLAGVYEDNHGSHIVVADVRDTDPLELAKSVNGPVEYFHASPVCKRYSSANTNAGETELDIETAQATADAISAMEPKVVTIENVAGYKDSEALKIITDRLTELGYNWDANTYTASDYGAYTKRKRLIVRAVKNGILPAMPEKTPQQGGWMDAVSDLIPSLKETTLPNWIKERAAKEGLNVTNPQKPLLISDSGTPGGGLNYAYGDELAPTILANGTRDFVIMPDGHILEGDARFLARITGLSDDYKLPKEKTRAHTIIGNGVPPALMRAVVAPLIEENINKQNGFLATDGSPRVDRHGKPLTPFEREVGYYVAESMAESGIEVVTDIPAIRKVIADAKKDNSESGRLRFMKDENDKVVGCERNGVIYLDPRTLDAEAGLHEYSRLWTKAMRYTDPETWSKVVNALKKDADSWNIIKGLNPAITDENEIASEMIAKYTGEKGKERLEKEFARLSARENAPSKTTFGNALKNIADAINEFWRTLGKWFGLGEVDAQDVYDMVMMDFSKKVNPYARVEEAIRNRDAEYAEAAERGDKKTAIRLVNEALEEYIGNGIVPYISVKGYADIRSLARAVKRRDPAEIKKAAKLMAKYIPDNAVLIPIPSHTGKATDMLDLANEIGRITNSPVADVLVGVERKSQYQAKKEGSALTPSEIGIEQVSRLPDGKIPVFIDNVVNTGNTAKAAVDAVGKGIVVCLGSTSGSRYGRATGLKSANIFDANGKGNLIPLSERFNLRKEGARFSISAPTFYSNAAHTVEGVKQEKAKAEQWKAMLTKAGGIKAGEDKWMGLSAWLDEHKGETLTKDEVRQFVADNGIEMEEVKYSEEGREPEVSVDDVMQSPEFSDMVSELVQYDENEDPFIDNELFTEKAESDEDFDDGFRIDYWGEGIEVNDPVAAARYLGLLKSDDYENAIDETRLRYTTEDLENKREIAFVVPGVEPYQEHDEIHFGPENQGRAVMWVRFGETRDTDGNRVLVIDEIQSNRHQDAREKGYRSEEPAWWKEAENNNRAIREEMEEKYGDAFVYAETDAEFQSFMEPEDYKRYKVASDAFVQSIRDSRARDKEIPAAPFEKNWHEVAMKRMLRLAAEEGFDKVAWTTGAQQASRYDLGSSVDFIEVNNHVIDGRTVYIRHTNGNQTEFTVDENGNIQGVLSHLQIKEGTPLSELVGKELADKIMQADNAKFEGKDLFVGGAGMRAFYDGMLPQFMNKYGKRWGVKVGEVELNTPGRETMHSVDVNEDMKRSVMQGQPLFSLSLGAPYQGSKGQIATRVVDGLPRGRRFVDLFAGGGAATHAAMLSGKYGEYRINDINPAGLELFLKGINGDYRDYIPRELTPEEFKAIKGTAEGLLLSYSGYGRNVDNDKESVARRLRRVQRLELLKPYADQVESSNSDYRDVELEPGDVVYADIPYEGTNKTGYREGVRFDKQAFSDWGLAQDVPVYVSEQSMPEGWVEVASWNMKAMRGKTRGEKLFVQERFAGDEGRGGAATRGTGRVGNATYNDNADARFSIDTAVAEAEKETETEPTDGQKESGNYRKGHVKIDGFDISIEQPKGSVRSGVDADGKEWSQEMHNTYGYIRGTEGVDGDHIDVFLSDHLDDWNGNVYVVDQVNKDRSFDEHKVMYGFNSEQEARDAYLSNYEEGWTGLGNIMGVSREEFKKWVDSSHRKNKPFAEYKNVKPLQSSATENNGEFSRENPDIRFSISEESQKIFDTAKRKFGETKDIREAGYVLPDGTMLDFSGRHELDPGTDSSFLKGRRTTDHRAINQISFVYDEKGDEVDTGVNSDMPDFIKRGAIRIDNNAGLINLSTAPTSAQKKVLHQLIADNGGDVQVDFGDGWDTDHYVEYDQAKSTRVLGDIDRYFDEGIKPQSNVRFSLSGDGTVEAYNKAVNMTGRTVNVLGRERKPGLTRYNFQEAFQDAILAVKKLQQVVERHFGIKLPTRENAWMYENRLSSINMQERKSFIDKVYEPMMKIADAIMKRGVKEKELNAYLICKHGLERNQVFAARDAQAEADEIARNGGTPDMQQLLDKYRQRDYSGLTGVTGIEGDIADIEAEAQRIVDEFEQRHGQLCNELWDAIRKATQWSLRKSYQSGMMSAATFDHVRNMFQYYIPLRGWSDKTAEDVYSYMDDEYGLFNGVLKKAVGRTSVADDPLATIGNMAESALMQGNRNLLKQHLLRMAQNHPTDVCQVRDVWLVEGPGGVWEPHWPNIPENATPDEIDQILQDHEADMLQLEAGGSAKRVRNNLDIPYRIDERHVPEHAVVAKVAGIDHVVYINGNPRAAQAMNGQTGAAQGKKSGFTRWIDFIFGDLKRYYSSVLTSLNINFSGANFVRDLPHAYAMTFSKYGPLKAAQYIAKSFQVIPWVFKNQLGKTGTSQMDRYFQEFLSSGSVTGYAHINDVDAWKADNKRRWARLSALGKAQVAVPRALGEVINAIGWFSETLELIPRFTAFLVERQSGKDIATATKAAKDITTNFNKKGSEVTPGVWGAVANTLRYMKMFFNPIVQGMYQFVDVASTGKENKWVGPRLALATMHLPVLGAIVPYLNQFLLEALGGDDDDDYWLLNEYTRRNNVCIFTGNGYVKIPIAPVFRELYGMGEVVATRHYGKADNEKTAIDLIDQLRTMGSVEGQSSYNEWSLARFLLPEHFAPFIDVMNNENFTGGPIYYDNHYKEFAPEYTKAKKSTWSPLVAASKWLNEMMGGDEDIAASNSGKWMNPAVWQHVITNVGGGFAQLAGDVVSGVTDIAEGKEIDASNIPVAKRFYSGSSEERAQWARFGIYKDYEKEYTMAKEKYQALDKRGLSLTERADAVTRFAESHPKAAAIYAVWEGGIKGADIPQQLSKLGKDDPKYWDLVKEAVDKAEKAMNSGYVRAWEQKRKDRPDSMSDKELNDRFDKSDNDSIRHIMGDEIAKRAGSQDYYGREAQATWSDKSVAAWEAYQGQRTSDDIKADAELSNLLKVDDGEKDKARIKMLGYIKDELNKIRRGKDATSRSAGVKGLGEGDDERVMEELRAARKQLIEDLKNGSAEQAYRNLERRTMRLGLRKKAKEL